MVRLVKLGVVASAMFLLSSLGLFAQPRDGGRQGGEDWYQKMKQERIAFFTSEIGLSEAEAKAFWPIYDESENAQRDAARASMEAYKALLKAVKDNADEAEISNLLHAYLDADKTSKTVKDSYIAKYEKVLSASKVAKVFLAEEKFRQQQIQKLHGGPQGGRPQGDRGGFHGDSHGGGYGSVRRAQDF